MSEYMICNQADEKLYRKQCEALEKQIPNLNKGEELVDVDESRIQQYFLNMKKISVCNSVYLDCLFIKSEIDLEQYFD